MERNTSSAIALSSNELRRFEIEGVDLGYPTIFRDGSSAAALFVVDARVAQERIAETGFEIAEIAPGKGILALTGVHYTDTDCGVYEETAQAFFVRRLDEKGAGLDGWPLVGRYLATWRNLLTQNTASYTWKLQVTTTLSQQCGLQMWGFPKTLGAIEFAKRDETASFALRMDDADVFRLSVPARGERTPPSVTSTVYSIYEGAAHVGHLTQRYRETGVFLGEGKVELGDHPLADELRALGLPRRPLLATWNGHLAFAMSAPEKL